MDKGEDRWNKGEGEVEYGGGGDGIRGRVMQGWDMKSGSQIKSRLGTGSSGLD